MPFQSLNDGLYLVSRDESPNGTAYAVLDVGNQMGFPLPLRNHPVIIRGNQRETGIHWLGNSGSWSLVGHLSNPEFAADQIRRAMIQPEIGVFGDLAKRLGPTDTWGIRQGLSIAAGVAVPFRPC